MGRKPIIAANWKMNLTMAESTELVDKVIKGMPDEINCEVLLFPSFLHIPMVAEKVVGTGIGCGGQNLFFEEKGAFTGEVSPMQLKDVGCTHVLIGHSERRHYFNEDYETVNLKVKKAIASGLKVMLCVGESLEERESNVTEMVVVDQIESAMEGIGPEKLNDMSIAYEPIWAIGTGKTATPEDAAHVHKIIRKSLSRIFDAETAEKMCILYGGSVKPDNIEELMSEVDVDGALIGGASLKSESFLKMIELV